MKIESLDADCQEENEDTQDPTELSQSKTTEKELKEEIAKLTSSLAEERQKNLHNENLIQMRSEHIKILLETDEINKTRAITYLRESEKLREKVLKLEIFNAAKDEEMKNMFNTLKNQEFEVERLKHELQQKDLKLAKYKKKMNSDASSQ